MDWCNSFGHFAWLYVRLGFLMSKHEKVIKDFMHFNKNWERYNLRQKLNNIFVDDPLEPLNYIPDGFFIDVENRILNLLEVDGTSGTTKIKLRKLIDLWWQMDGRCWELTLTSISVYTEAKSYMTDIDFQSHALVIVSNKSKQERKQYGNVNA
jgi:hypothetical protein